MTSEVDDNNKWAENYTLETGLDEDDLYSMIDENDAR